jgi:hypothetical protein
MRFSKYIDFLLLNQPGRAVAWGQILGEYQGGIYFYGSYFKKQDSKTKCLQIESELICCM